MNPARKRIESLYVLKAICAFFVVSIHVPLPQEIMYPLAGVGTPCFLCITGYLLYSADKERELNKCTNWAAKSFWLAIMCNIIYGIATFIIHGKNVLTSGWMFHVKNIVFGEEVSPYLWYLAALWEALLIMRCIIKFAPRLINFLPLLFIFAFLLRNADPMIHIGNFSIASTFLRNTCVCTSLPFLATGYLVHKHHKYLLSALNIYLWLGITFALVIAEYLLRLSLEIPLSHFFIFTYPLIVLLMLTCVKHPDFTLPFLSDIGKKHSPNIYYFHGIFIWLLPYIKLSSWHILTLTACIYIACIPCSYIFNSLTAIWKNYVWEPCWRALLGRIASQ